MSVRLIILYLLFIWLFLNFDNIYLYLETLLGLQIEFMSFSYFYMVLYFILFFLLFNPFGIIGSNLWILRYEFLGLIFLFWFYSGFMNSLELLVVSFWHNISFYQNFNFTGFDLIFDFFNLYVRPDYRPRFYDEYNNLFPSIFSDWLHEAKEMYDETVLEADGFGLELFPIIHDPIVEKLRDLLVSFDILESNDYDEWSDLRIYNPKRWKQKQHEMETGLRAIMTPEGEIDYVVVEREEEEIQIDYINIYKNLFVEKFLNFKVNVEELFGDIFESLLEFNEKNITNFSFKKFIFLTQLQIINLYLYTTSVPILIYYFSELCTKEPFYFIELFKDFFYFRHQGLFEGYVAYYAMRYKLNELEYLEFLKNSLSVYTVDMWGNYNPHKSHFFLFYDRAVSYSDMAMDHFMEAETAVVEEDPVYGVIFLENHNIHLFKQFFYGLDDLIDSQEEYFRDSSRIKIWSKYLHYNRYEEPFEFPEEHSEQFFNLLVPDMAFIGGSKWFYDFNLIDVDRSIDHTEAFFSGYSLKPVDYQEVAVS